MVGGRLTTNALAEDLWQYNPANGLWIRLPVLGPKPQTVLASTYRPSDRSLFVVDEVKTRFTRAARILQIDLTTHQSRVLGAWPRHAFIDAVFVSVGPDGEIVLAGSSSSMNRYLGIVLRTDLRGLLIPKGGVARGG